MTRLGLLLSALSLSLVWPVAGAPQQLPARARDAEQVAEDLLRMHPREVLVELLGFGHEQLERLDAREVVVGDWLFAEGDEFALGGAIRVRGDRETFVRTMHPAWRFARSAGATQMGVFGDPPAASDLAEMRLGASLLSEIRSCRPGSCGIQLSQAMMETLQDGVDWNAPGAEALVESRAREAIVRSLRDYQLRGYRDAPPYADARRPVDRVAHFDALMDHAMIPAAQSGALYQYLAAYPGRPMEGVEDTFYWMRTGGTAGTEPTLSLVHAVTWQSPGEADRVTILDRLLYSTQYVTASLGETMILDDPDREGGYYVLKLQRVRFRIGGGLARGVIMKRVQAAMREALQAELVIARDVAARG